MAPPGSLSIKCYQKRNFFANFAKNQHIEESARPLGKRIKEHITTRYSSTSAVSEHLKTAKHHFDPNKVKSLRIFPEKNLGSHSHLKGEARSQYRQGVGFESRMY